MLFSEERFYEALDRSIPELREASDDFYAGNTAGAEHAFASYIKKTLRPDIYLGTKIPEQSPAALAKADRICDGEVVSTGLAYVFKDNQYDWEINPTFNGYKEWTWQLSRHPEFENLARAYRYTKDEKYARRYVIMITSWIAQAVCPENLPGNQTKTWRTIEAGIRMLSNWHVAIHSFLDSPSVSDADWVLIFRSVYEHVYRLRGFRTTHNWLIMEMGGLVNIAVLYPFFKDSGEWYRDGMDTLFREIETQLYPDDFQFELSSGYHGVNIGNYQNVVTLCRKYGREVPPEFVEAIRRMYRLYAKLARPNKTTPALNDGGAVDVCHKMRSAILAYPEEEVFRWFATEGKEGREPSYTSVVLPYSGQVVMRQNWKPDAVWAFFDGGPFGFGHQHEDKLAFELFAYGADMLPDAGNYEYDTSDQRAYILGTRSHNTGLVDGRGQSRREVFHWEHDDIHKKAKELRYRNGDVYEVAESTYSDGYGKRPRNEEGKIPAEFHAFETSVQTDAYTPAIHRRKVIFFKQGWQTLPPFFVLLDDFTAKEGKHTFEVSFQLTADPMTLTQNGARVSYANGASLILSSNVYPTASVGQYVPEYKGWQSIRAQGAHEHQPAPVLAFPNVGCAASFATVVLPLPDGRDCPVRITRTESAFTLTLGELCETFQTADFETDDV